MTMLCKTCPDGETARRLAGALSAVGVPAENIQLLIGPHGHDAADEQVRIADDAATRQLLLAAHVPELTADRILYELQDGHAALVVHLDQMDTTISEALTQDAPLL